ncbi:hypothetical protein DQ239_13025 [Blastococcus sp. TF02-09]|uniref:hypothetical protein n=1 Tax=Blastococcus sp. TF02-09 TaxID=2250576 RepID=UPI000DEB57EE|nr:hypothetical protein [Blastococcus sp. TF02-9]RBY76480.1 hypothetical protein DQ239_13025 [Blastococcus sp. TF02-9]
MGLLDRLFGRSRQQHTTGYGQAYQGQGYQGPGRYARQPDGQPLPDEQAVARYRYLLRTAPPEQIEQAHAEAFAQLTADQRQQVLAQLAAAVPAGERPRTDDADTLARVATRAEMRQPGTLERALGGYGPGYGSGYGPGYGPGYGRGGYGPGYGGGMGMGGMIGGSLLGTIGGLVIGTAVADALFDTGLGDGGLFGGGDEEAYAEGYQDGAGDFGGDYGDYGDGGGDFGGGDFGGGDFGGGDFGGGDF